MFLQKNVAKQQKLAEPAVTKSGIRNWMTAESYRKCMKKAYLFHKVEFKVHTNENLEYVTSLFTN